MSEMCERILRGTISMFRIDIVTFDDWVPEHAHAP
ncbi:hypothetical protein ACVWXU_000522 [Streptomyces sp. TE33382]